MKCHQIHTKISLKTFGAPNMNVYLPFLCIMLTVLTACDNSKQNQSHKLETRLRKGAISISELGSKLKPGTSYYEVVAELGDPPYEIRESEDIREISYVRSVTGVPVSKDESVLGFRLRFKNMRLVYWWVEFVDSSSGTNNIIKKDPPVTSTESFSLDGNDKPIQVFLLPTGMKLSQSVLQPALINLMPNLAIDATTVKTVRQVSGDIKLVVELNSGELSKLSSFVDEHLDQTVAFVVNGMPRSVVRLGQPMNYYRFELPLNVK